jgi:hypothetical protein
MHKEDNCTTSTMSSQTAASAVSTYKLPLRVRRKYLALATAVPHPQQQLLAPHTLLAHPPLLLAASCTLAGGLCRLPRSSSPSCLLTARTCAAGPALTHHRNDCGCSLGRLRQPAAEYGRRGHEPICFKQKTLEQKERAGHV